MVFTIRITFLFKNVDLVCGCWTWDLGSCYRPADNFNDLEGLTLYQNLKQELSSSSQTSLVGTAKVCSQITYCKIYFIFNQRLIGEKYLGGGGRQGTENDSAIKREWIAI